MYSSGHIHTYCSSLHKNGDVNLPKRKDNFALQDIFNLYIAACVLGSEDKNKRANHNISPVIQ